MKKLIGIVLLIIALALGYTGIEKLNTSTATIDLIGLQFAATDEEKKNKGMLYAGLAVIFLLGGVTLVDDNKWITVN